MEAVEVVVKTESEITFPLLDPYKHQQNQTSTWPYSAFLCGDHKVTTVHCYENTSKRDTKSLLSISYCC